jgi:hypothetical protein
MFELLVRGLGMIQAILRPSRALAEVLQGRVTWQPANLDLLRDLVWMSILIEFAHLLRHGWLAARKSRGWRAAMEIVRRLLGYPPPPPPPPPTAVCALSGDLVWWSASGLAALAVPTP